MCMKLQRCNKSVFSHDLGPRQRHIVIVHRRRLRMLLAEELSHGSHSRLSELLAALLKPFVRLLRWLREARGAASCVARPSFPRQVFGRAPDLAKCEVMR